MATLTPAACGTESRPDCRFLTRVPSFNLISGRGFYGNSARNILTGPGQQVWNMVLAKNFMIKESARIQFRWEMFNAFNRANFGNPDTNISGGSFGLVGGANSGRAMLFGLRIDY